MAQRQNGAATVSNGIKVYAGMLGSTMQEIDLAAGATVQNLFSVLGAPDNAEARINGEMYAAGDLLDNGDVIVVIAGERPSGR